MKNIHKKSKSKIKICLVSCAFLISAWGINGCMINEKADSQKNNEKTDGHSVGEVKEFSKTDFVMNTVLSETIYGSEDITAEIKERLSSLETEQLSWRQEESMTARINEKCNQGQSVTMDEDFAGWTEVCLDLAKKSGGAFDPTIGRLTRLWNIEGEHPVVPAQSDIEKELKSIGYSYINIEGTAISMRRNCTLDLGAVGKGIGCDVVRNYLDSKKNVDGAVVAIGGSILTYGKKPDGTDWTVAIQNPEKEEGSYIGVVNLQGTASVSTSGDYEKYFIQDGKRYHHILDPFTGYPSESGLSSVTVVCRDEGEWKENAGLLSDGLSTACFVLGKEKGIKLLEEYGAEGVFIDKNKKVTVTDGLKDSFTVLDEEYE